MSRSTMKKIDRAAVFTASEGKCHVCGEEVPPLASWSVVEGHLLCTPCNKERSGRPLSEFAEHLAEKVCEARATIARWGRLATTNDEPLAVIFRGDIMTKDLEELRWDAGAGTFVPASEGEAAP